MKRTGLAAFTALCLPCAVSAQSSVQLYGAIDAYVDTYKAGDKSAVRLQSGGASTSRWGVTGTEDLGGGLKAEFRLESGFNLDDGTVANSTSFFNRESNVSLYSEAMGRIKLGKQYPALLPEFVDPFLGVAKFTLFGFSAAGLAPGATNIATRVDNAISYTTPSYPVYGGKLLGQALIAPRESDRADVARVSNQGLRVAYEIGKTYFGASFNQTNSDPVRLASGVTLNEVRTDHVGMALIHDFSPLLLSLAYLSDKPRVAGAKESRAYTVGGVYKTGRHTVRVSAAYRDVTDSPDDAVGLILGYEYALSKRTDLYGRAGRVLNRGRSAVAIDAVSLAAGDDMRSLGLGIRHRF